MGKIYDEMLKYEHAKSMFYKIKRNCKNKQAIYEYNLYLNSNLYRILELLYLHKYKFSRYRIFMIRDPKFRIIMSENISDKLVNHLVSKYILLRCLESKLIDTNVATRINKGSGYAFNKFVKYINKLKYKNKEIYILKVDIKKYFYNIDHKILMSKVKKYIKDKCALRIIEEIINSTNEKYINERINYLKDSRIKYINSLNISKKEKEAKINTIKSIPLYNYNKGLPIGNMTSQILGIFYLNDVDHYIKEKLKFKYYIRYMDDILIVDTDKEKLINSFNLIEKEINKLNLEINSKSNLYKLSNGISFLGYVFKLNKNNKLIIRYNNNTIRRLSRKLKNLKRFDKDRYVRSLGSYKGYLDKSNTRFKDNFFMFSTNNDNYLHLLTILYNIFPFYLSLYVV